MLRAYWFDDRIIDAWGPLRCTQQYLRAMPRHDQLPPSLPSFGPRPPNQSCLQGPLYSMWGQLARAARAGLGYPPRGPKPGRALRPRWSARPLVAAVPW
jgi:hypothetical protein